MIPPYRIGCTRTPPGRNLHRVCYNDVDRGGAVLHLHHHHTGASAPAPLLLNHRPNYYTVVIRYSPPRGESVPASLPPPSRTRPCPPPPSIITETSPRRYIQGVHCHSNPPPLPLSIEFTLLLRDLLPLFSSSSSSYSRRGDPVIIGGRSVIAGLIMEVTPPPPPRGTVESAGTPAINP